MDEIIIDEVYKFDRAENYIPMGDITVEGEIRRICKENNIVVSEFKTYKTYSVLGKKVKDKKTCIEIQNFIDSNESEKLEIRPFKSVTHPIPETIKNAIDKFGKECTTDALDELIKTLQKEIIKK